MQTWSTAGSASSSTVGGAFVDRRLAEFKLTTPRTNIPDDAPAVRMNVQGRVETISDRPIA